MSFNVRMRSKVNRLLALAAVLAPGRDERIALVSGTLLAEDAAAAPRPAASCLNHDGTPLQLCLTAGPDGQSLRLIADPGADEPDSARRYAITRDAIRQGLIQGQAEGLAALTETSLTLLLPDDAAAWTAYRNGFAWVAVSPQKPGIALYLETAPLGVAAGWAAVARWLAAILPGMTHAAPLLESLARLCQVASAGLEGSTPANARAKIYFRLRAPAGLEELGIGLLTAPAMLAFLGQAMGGLELDLDGLVMSIGFSIATGALVDAKIDLCGHCLRRTLAEWAPITQALCQDFGLHPLDVAALPEDCEVAFIGLGLTTQHAARLNLYLKPAAPAAPPGRAALTAALDDAVAYLQAARGAEGGWWDYELPTGASDQWVSAYAGLALAEAGRLPGFAPARAMAEAAAAWLRGARSYAAGWGYNSATGPDADSTALAIALLDELGDEVPAADRAFLLSHWRGPAGIATYDEPSAWGDAHWDVTPLGYMGLPLPERLHRTGDFVAALHANRMGNGLWRSYWWRNPYYASFITLDVLDRLGLPEPATPITPAAAPLPISNGFDLACYIGIEYLRDPNDARIPPQLRALLDWQREDGSWAGTANLRVTEPDCHAPWEQPAGNYYADLRGVLTTATVIRLLARLLAADKPAPAATPQGHATCLHKS